MIDIALNIFGQGQLLH